MAKVTTIASAETAFALVHYNCATGPQYTFGHEIGHLQGARHDLDQDPETTPYAYGHGFKYCPAPSTTDPNPDWCRTIMALECNCTPEVCGRASTCPAPQRNCPRARYWSSPNVHSCSVMGTAERENNARVLNETATTVAAFRLSQRERCETGCLSARDRCIRSCHSGPCRGECVAEYDGCVEGCEALPR